MGQVKTVGNKVPNLRLLPEVGVSEHSWYRDQQTQTPGSRARVGGHSTGRRGPPEAALPMAQTRLFGR